MIEDVDSDCESCENDSDNDLEDSSGNTDLIKDRQRIPPTCHGNENSLARIFRSNDRQLLLYQAILDQVLSLDGYKALDWTKIAECIGNKGYDPIRRSKEIFAQTWREFHDGKNFFTERRAKLTKHNHLLLAMIDELAGRVNKPGGKWVELASALDCHSEALPRLMFKHLWQKYLERTRPEACTPTNKSRGQKMDEWIEEMQSYDNGDDDEEPPPPYEEYDSRVSTKSQDESVNSDSDIEVVGTVVVLD